MKKIYNKPTVHILIGNSKCNQSLTLEDIIKIMRLNKDNPYQHFIKRIY